MEIVQWRRNFICFLWKCKSCTLCLSPFVLRKVFYILRISVQSLMRFMWIHWIWMLFFSLKHFLFFWYRLCRRLHSRGWTGSGLSESTPAGFCVLYSDPEPDPESKIWEKPVQDPKSLFNFCSSRSLCGRFLSKNMGKLRLDRWLWLESEQESDSQIWKNAGPGFKKFGTGAASESENVTSATSASQWSLVRVRKPCGADD